MKKQIRFQNMTHLEKMNTIDNIMNDFNITDDYTEITSLVPSRSSCVNKNSLAFDSLNNFRYFILVIYQKLILIYNL